MSDTEALKEALYNRQIYVYGKETQKKYSCTNILVLGLSGSGCELCKNLILTGIHKLTICDPRPVTWIDLNTMFFAQPEDVGKPRDKTLCSRFSELNRFVEVIVAEPSQPVSSTDDIINVSEDIIQSHQVTIACNLSTTSSGIINLNEMCRKYGNKFVSVETRGVSGLIFVDGGDNFTIFDPNGEETRSCVIVKMSKTGVVQLHDDKRHECEVNDKIYFMNLSGVPEGINTEVANEANPILFNVVEVIDPYTLRIQLPTSLLSEDNFAPSGGYMHTTKLPQKESYLSLKNSLQKGPQFVDILDVESKFGESSKVFKCFQAFHHYLESGSSSVSGISHPIRDEIICEEDLLLAASQCGMTDKAELDLLKLIGPVFNGNIPTTSCFFGSLAAQEALKLSSGKFTPLKQWLCYDFREILVNTPYETTNRSTLKCRYDGQLLVVGHSVHNNICGMSIFIVGAGALGCELIKNVALMGFGTKGTGKVTVTDMDNIEMSNLSRQFLFRNEHIGKSKSVVASEAARKINPDVRVLALTDKMGPETEHIFSTDFWQSIDLVLNALDNVASRRYVDAKCVANKLPLFDSGTLGSKCNVQVVIPYLTMSYSSSYDPPESSIPLCTLKNFPSNIEHTIQWARDNFEQEFTNFPNEYNRYLGSRIVEYNEILNREPGTKEHIIASLNKMLERRPRTAESCILFAREQFDSFFNHNIQMLLFNIPLDRVDDNGMPFWSGAKRPPVVLSFNQEKKEHLDFIKAASFLYAQVCRISENEKKRLVSILGVEKDIHNPELTSELKSILSTYVEKPFRPTVRRYALDEKDQENSSPTVFTPSSPSSLPSDVTSNTMPSSSFSSSYSSSIEEKEKEKKKNIPSSSSSTLSTSQPSRRDLPDPVSICDSFLRTQMHVEEFEKDDDNNRHIDYITAVSNLRALNYNIPPADRIKTKLISGRIIPAMITTTTFVTGAVVGEVYKYCSNEKKIENYRNLFSNLAINLHVVNEPEACVNTEYINPQTGEKLSFSLWDSIDINEGRDLTLEELLSYLQNKYHIDIFMISTDTGKTLYMEFSPNNKLKMPIGEIVKMLGEPMEQLGDALTLVVTCSFGDEDCDAFPNVTYQFRKFRRVEG